MPNVSRATERPTNWGMADLAACGLRDLSIFETTAFPLGSVNEALSTLGGRNGGFTSFVAKPQQ